MFPRHLTRTLSIVAAMALVASGCTSSAASPSAAAASTGPAATTMPAAAAGPQLTVFYEENCQVELIAPSGQRLLVDVSNPAALSSPPTASDTLLTTHLHGDHYVASFESSFPGKKLTNAAGDLTAGDAKIKSLDASHSDNDPTAATDHIFVIDFAGFHIAHLGSMGQDQLTSAQLAAIGTPDIAFAVLIDLSASGSVDAARPIRVVDQMKPRLLIPTHTKLDSVKLVSGKWDGSFAEKKSVKISKDKLSTATSVLFMGQLAPSYGAILNLSATTL